MPYYKVQKKMSYYKLQKNIPSEIHTVQLQIANKNAKNQVEKLQTHCVTDLLQTTRAASSIVLEFTNVNRKNKTFRHPKEMGMGRSLIIQLIPV